MSESSKAVTTFVFMGLQSVPVTGCVQFDTCLKTQCADISTSLPEQLRELHGDYIMRPYDHIRLAEGQTVRSTYRNTYLTARKTDH